MPWAQKNSANPSQCSLFSLDGLGRDNKKKKKKNQTAALRHIACSPLTPDPTPVWQSKGLVWCLDGFSETAEMGT